MRRRLCMRMYPRRLRVRCDVFNTGFYSNEVENRCRRIQACLTALGLPDQGSPHDVICDAPRSGSISTPRLGSARPKPELDRRSIADGSDALPQLLHTYVADGEIGWWDAGEEGVCVLAEKKGAKGRVRVVRICQLQHHAVFKVRRAVARGRHRSRDPATLALAQLPPGRPQQRIRW